MNKYQKELQQLKTWDEVQFCQLYTHTFNSEGIYPESNYTYPRITTAGHGYMVIDRSEITPEFDKILGDICQYGFVGKLAYYMEEDCEEPQTLDAIHNQYKKWIDQQKHN